MDEVTRQWPRGTIHLLANRINSAAHGKDYIDWAVHALSYGLETPNLILLAGLDLDGNVSISEAEFYFDKCLQELGLSVPDDETILRLYLSEISQHSAEETLDPKEGINCIHSQIVNPFYHPKDLMPWCFLWEGNSPSGHFVEYSEDEHSKAIVDYAKTWNKGIAKHEVA